MEAFTKGKKPPKKYSEEELEMIKAMLKRTEFRKKRGNIKRDMTYVKV